MPCTDDADLYLLPVARCYRKIMVDNGKLASADALMNRFGLWCDTWAPHLTTDQAADMVRQLLAEPPKFDLDDELGARLRLTYAERHRLKIKTIGSYDVDRKSRTKLRQARKRERDRLRAAEKRKANGATPRAVYQANCLSTTKPWEAMGISRRTYERRRKTASSMQPDQIDASPSPHPLISKSDALASPAKDLATTDRIGLTKPPADAVGTTKKSKSIEVGVDGAAVVGGPARRLRTRFPTCMRLTKEVAAYALAAGFDRKKILRMFEMFRDHNIAQRTYSPDWDQAWVNWVDREVDIVNDWHDRARRRAYFARLAA